MPAEARVRVLLALRRRPSRRALWATVIAACCSIGAHGQQASPAPASGQTPSAASAVISARIDELIRQTNDQLNVKGQFERAAEFARQALDLSEQAGDKVRAATAMVYLSAAYGYQGRL